MKTLASILSALLLLVLPCALTLAASAPDILPVPGTHALLARCGEETFLIGGEDEQAVAQTIPNAIDGVIRLCEHVEYSAAVEALAARYGVSLYAPGDALPLDDAAWQGQTLRLSIGGTSYAFGADSAQEGAITYRCDGTPFAYSGNTNESAVNVRAKTSTKSDRVGKLRRGELITILGLTLSEQGEYWYSVQLADGTTGYIRSDLLIPSASGTPVQTVQAAANVPSSSGTRYIGNKNSKVFHRPTCHTLPAPKNQVYADSRDYFISKGFRPCKNCDP